MQRSLPCRSPSCPTSRFLRPYAIRPRPVAISDSVMSSKFCCDSQRNGGPIVAADLTFLFSSATVPTWWTQHPAKYPVLTGWFAGPKADAVARLTVSELVDMGLASLAEIFDLSLDRVARDLVTS